MNHIPVPMPVARQVFTLETEKFSITVTEETLFVRGLPPAVMQAILAACMEEFKALSGGTPRLPSARKSNGAMKGVGVRHAVVTQEEETMAAEASAPDEPEETHGEPTAEGDGEEEAEEEEAEEGEEEEEAEEEAEEEESDEEAEEEEAAEEAPADAPHQHTKASAEAKSLVMPVVRGRKDPWDLDNRKAPKGASKLDMKHFNRLLTLREKVNYVRSVGITERADIIQLFMDNKDSDNLLQRTEDLEQRVSRVLTVMEI